MALKVLYSSSIQGNKVSRLGLLVVELGTRKLIMLARLYPPWVEIHTANFMEIIQYILYLANLEVSMIPDYYHIPRHIIFMALYWKDSIHSNKVRIWDWLIFVVVKWAHIISSRL